MSDTSNIFEAIDREIIADAFTSNETQNVLYGLCDEVGIRFSGTEGEKRGAEFILSKFNEYGLDNTYIEEFEFTAWTRGEAGLSVLEPVERSIPCLALPYGAETETNGVVAKLLDIGDGSADRIEQMKEEIAGAIVLTDASAAHRSEIYGRVAKAGAVGFILHGKAAGMMLPTGCVSFGKSGSIPAVGIAWETGLLFKRLADRGEVKLRLTSNSTVGKGISRNVVGEIKGTKNPDEFVVVGGHMDSHDIAPGAVDNASGTTCVVETARLLANRRGKLERSARFIGFGAEEVGLLGSYHHAEKHKDKMSKIRLMINLDCPPTSRPKGIVSHMLPGGEKWVEALRIQMKEPLTFAERVHCHSDHFPFVANGVPTMEIAGGPFDPKVRAFAHMAGDTVDKVSLIDLRENAALAARLLLRGANDPDWPFRTRTNEEVQKLLEESGIAKALEYEAQNS